MFLGVDDRLGIEAVGRALGRHQAGDLAGEVGRVEPVVDDDAALARDQRRQLAATPTPSGDTAPMPVMTIGSVSAHVSGLL